MVGTGQYRYPSEQWGRELIVLPCTMGLTSTRYSYIARQGSYVYYFVHLEDGPGKRNLTAFRIWDGEIHVHEDGIPELMLDEYLSLFCNLLTTKEEEEEKKAREEGKRTCLSKLGEFVGTFIRSAVSENMPRNLVVAPSGSLGKVPFSAVPTVFLDDDVCCSLAERFSGGIYIVLNLRTYVLTSQKKLA